MWDEIYDYIDYIEENEFAYDDYDGGAYIPSDLLESYLSTELNGLDVSGMRNKTRSKYIKQNICELLGYGTVQRFKRGQKDIPGQVCDVFSLAANNMQVYNHKLDPHSRYIVVNIDRETMKVKNVRVTTSDVLNEYHSDNWTSKYQACMCDSEYSQLFSVDDTPEIQRLIDSRYDDEPVLGDPSDLPSKNSLLPISEIYDLLLELEGEHILCESTNERETGDAVHQEVCSALGYDIFEDNGQYPDITNQLLEIKFQTSSTIDLGQHSPNDGEIIFTLGKGFHKTEIFSEDVRYAIIAGSVFAGTIDIEQIFVVNGRDFGEYFPICSNVNKKLQLTIPNAFFD